MQGRTTSPTPPRPLRRRLGRAAPGARYRAPARARPAPAGHRRCRPATARPATTCPRGTSLDPADQALLRPVHGGLRGHGRQHRPDGRAPVRRARGAGRGSTNTIFVFLSDNGASREGEACGHDVVLPHPRVARTSRTSRTSQFDRDRIDLAGGPQALVHYPRGWAMASNTPFRLYKINTHCRRPLGAVHPVVAPRGRRRGAARPVGPRHRRAAHVVRARPASNARRARNGIAAPAAGRHEPGAGAGRPGGPPTSADRSTSRWRATAATTTADWEVVTRHEPLTEFGDHEWELYDLAEDRTEIARPRRRAARAGGRAGGRRGRRRRGRTRCTRSRRGRGYRYVVRPPYDDALQEPVRIVAGTHTLERYRVAAADPVALVRRRRRAAPSRPATRACWSPTATRAAGTRCTSTTATSWSSRTTATASMTEVRGGTGARRRRGGSGSPSTAPGGWTWDVPWRSTARRGRATRGS